MSLAPNDPLLTAGRVVVFIGQILMVVSAAVCLAVIPVILFFQGTIAAEFAVEFPDVTSGFPIMPLIGLLLFGAALGVLGWFFLRHLRRIIDSVGDGDPFVPENATRLTAMGWITVVIQLISLPAAALGVYFITLIGEDRDLTIDAGVDGYAIILIITLFILARVFRHGTAMRDDLEGTV